MKIKIFTKSPNFLEGKPHQHSEKMDDGVMNELKTEEFEHCVMCGALTNIPISTPVDWRENYELGLGQICTECAKKQREAAEL